MRRVRVSPCVVPVPTKGQRLKLKNLNHGLYIIGGEFRTKDSVSQVVEFYRHQLPSLMIISRRDESARLKYKEGGIQRIISIEEHGDETRIGVASIGDRASN